MIPFVSCLPVPMDIQWPSPYVANAFMLMWKQCATSPQNAVCITNFVKAFSASVTPISATSQQACLPTLQECDQHDDDEDCDDEEEDTIISLRDDSCSLSTDQTRKKKRRRQKSVLSDGEEISAVRITRYHQLIQPFVEMILSKGLHTSVDIPSKSFRLNLNYERDQFKDHISRATSKVVLESSSCVTFEHFHRFRDMLLWPMRCSVRTRTCWMLLIVYPKHRMVVSCSRTLFHESQAWVRKNVVRVLASEIDRGDTSKWLDYETYDYEATS